VLGDGGRGQRGRGEDEQGHKKDKAYLFHRAPLEFTCATGSHARQGRRRDKVAGATAPRAIRPGDPGGLWRLSVHLSFRAVRPGSSLPSSISSEAPPPVEMWAILSASPACWMAATESPPPQSWLHHWRQHFGYSRGAFGKGSHLKNAHRPVPDHILAPLSWSQTARRSWGQCPARASQA